MWSLVQVGILYRSWASGYDDGEGRSDLRDSGQVLSGVSAQTGRLPEVMVDGVASG